MRKLLFVLLILFAVMALSSFGQTSNCYVNVSTQTPQCTGGTITSDAWDGCRNFVCTGGSNSIKVKTCDKPGGPSSNFYEMYRTLTSGTRLGFCLGSTCFGSSDFAKSQDYNVCSNQASADLRPITTQRDLTFPFDHNAAFQCLTNGFNATNYTFNFGDGSSETRPVFDVYHTYTQNGTFTVTCTAFNQAQSASDSIQVNIITGKIDTLTNPFMAASADVQKLSQNGLTATFRCEDYGFAANAFRWKINDPQFQGETVDGHISGNKEFTYTFSSAGNYEVSCRGFLLEPEQAPVYYDYKTWYHSYDCRGAYWGDCAIWPDTKTFLIQQTSANTSQCYSKVNDIPANCTATITSDVKSGCRTIICSSGSDTIKVQACDKTGFFEMYRQSYAGTPPKVCLANVCMQNEGYKKSPNYPICVGTATNTPPTNTTPPPSADPGATSRLWLNGGNLNGQSVGSSKKNITVSPGERISGPLDFLYNSTYGSNAVMVFAATPNWGNHQSSCINYGSVATPHYGIKTINVDINAPTAPGTYYLLFQYRGEFTSGQVCSMTNWAAGNDIWNDANDMADWSANTIKTAQQTGNTLATIYHTDGYRPWYVPADAITIIVKNPAPSANSSTCYSKVNDIPASCTGGTITQDTKSGCRTLICASGSNSIKVMACNKPDSGPQYFEMYRQAASGAVPKLCIGSTCMQNEGFKKSPNYPICTTSNATNTSTTTVDPGATSSLFLDYGSLNGKGMYDNRPWESSRRIIVTPGQNIMGNLNFEYNSSWASGTSVVFGMTPSWGDHASIYKSLGTLNAGTGFASALVNLSAPNAPGLYYITFAYRAETTAAHLISMTNWAKGSPVWNDGNDIAGWTTAQINQANTDGRTIGQVLGTSGMRNYYVPATAIEVEVRSPEQLNHTSMNFIINGNYMTLSTTQPLSERTFYIPVRGWSLAGAFFEAAGYNSYYTGRQDIIYREQGSGGKIVSDTFCDGSSMNVELLGTKDVSATNPARVHIIRKEPGYKDLEVILNFVPTNSNVLTSGISSTIEWDWLGEAFIHQYIRDRHDVDFQHYFDEGSSLTPYNKTVFLERVNQYIASGKTSITLSSERIKHPTDATAKNRYIFNFRNPSTDSLSQIKIESEYMGGFSWEDHNLWQSSRYDIYLLRKAGIPVNEFSVVDSHWRSADCAYITTG